MQKIAIFFRRFSAILPLAYRRPCFSVCRSSVRVRPGSLLKSKDMRKVPDIVVKPSVRRQIARNSAGNGDALQIRPDRTPPYGVAPISQNTPCTLDRTANTKEWFVTTPAAALISDGKVGSSWEAEAPDFDAIVRNLEDGQKTAQNVSFISTDYSQTRHYKVKGGEGYDVRIA